MAINERALVTVQIEIVVLLKESGELEIKYHQVLSDKECTSRRLDSVSYELAKVQHVVIGQQASISELE